MSADVDLPANQATDRPAIRATDLRVSYRAHLAIDTSTFAVPAGTVTTIIGPNGSGKSTLLRAIAGLIPFEGTLEVLGRARPDLRSNDVAMVLQHHHPNPRLPITVHETVALGRVRGPSVFHRMSNEDHAAIERAIDEMDIADLLDRSLTELSGGQRQRVFIAQALTQPARLILLDEPTTGLDAVSHERIITALRQRRDAGVTIVSSTHDLLEAKQADHLVLLAGRVVASGPASEVLTAEHLDTAYGRQLVHLADGHVVLDDAQHH